MILPSTIRTTVLNVDSGAPIPNILVVIDFLVNGRYYFGTLAGLTDNAGVITTTAVAITTDFVEDRKTFPMDYKVPLSEADNVLRIHVEGGAAFLQQRDSGLASGLVSAQARRLWTSASNANVAPSSLLVELDDFGSEVSVTLKVA